MSPAHVSARLQQLFPPGAVAAEMNVAGDPALLLPAERERLGRAVPKRVGEFTAGRLCARLALAQFALGDFALTVADDRQPRWPADVCGSITHTQGFCAAVVASRSALLSVGIDSERVGQVKADIWHAICGASELDWLHTLPAVERAPAATLIFSAKEAFYKCQYPVVREALGFRAVRVEPLEWGGDGGRFMICAERKLALSARAAFPLEGRYLFHDAVVTAGIGLTVTGDATQ